jgi:E3 ubiquitin-protein ligase RHF
VSHVLAGNQHEGPNEVEILLDQCIDCEHSLFIYGLVSLGFLAYCSQELLEAVEEERNVQENHARTTIFHHPLLGDFEVPVDADDAEIEERIIHHLAAAAAIRRSHRHARREGRRSRSAAHGHPQTLFFPTAEATSGGSMSSNSRQEGVHEHAPAVIFARPFPTVDSTEETGADTSVPGTSLANNGPVVSNNRVSKDQSSPVGQDEAGPSDVQSFSDSLKSRLQSVSTKYKDSITNSTRGWKERWFTQKNTISNLGSEVRREVNAGIAAVSRMMERLETRDGTGPSSTSATNVHSALDTNNQGASPPKVATVGNDASSSAT